MCVGLFNGRKANTEADRYLLRPGRLRIRALCRKSRHYSFTVVCLTLHIQVMAM